MIEEIKDIDSEIRDLVIALNTIPALKTTCSCCGHDKEPIRIWFDIGACLINKILFYFFNNLDPKIWSIKISTADPNKENVWVNCYLESGYLVSDMLEEIEKLTKHIKTIYAKYDVWHVIQ